MSENKNNLFKKIMSLCLVFSLLFTTVPSLVHGDSSTYSKASDWAKAEIESAQKSGVLPALLKGQDMTKFATREELCELAVLLYEKLNGKSVAVPEKNPFTDTKNKQIMKAYSLGITSGTSNTTFEPNTIINREQVATMFGRAIQKLYPNMDYSEIGAPDFMDKKDISSWALSHVLFLSKKGIIKGDDGKFRPRAISAEQKKNNYGTTTREQAIAITVRILNTELKDEKVFSQTIKNDNAQTLGGLNIKGWQLEVPANTFGKDLKFTMDEMSESEGSKLQPSNSKILGNVLKLSVDGKENIRLGLPINATIQIPKSQLSGLKADELFYGYYYGNQWNYYMPDSVDIDKGTISFDLYHFSQIGIFKLSEDLQIKTFAKNMATGQWEAKNQGKNIRNALGKQYDDLFLALGIGVELDRKQLAADLATYMESATIDSGGMAPIDALAQMANSASKGKAGMQDFQNKLLEFTGKGLVNVLEQMKNAKPGVYTEKFASSVNVVGNLSSALGSVQGGDNKAALESVGNLLKGLNPAILFGTTTLNFLKDKMENTIAGFTQNEIEKAYGAYIGNVNKNGYGSGLEGDIEAIFITLGGGERMTKLNVINGYCKKYGIDPKQLTEAERNKIFSNALKALEENFKKRKIEEAEIGRIQKAEEAFLKAIKDKGLLSSFSYNKFFRDGKGVGKYSVGDRLEKIYKLRDLVLSYEDKDKISKLSNAEIASLIDQWIFWGEKGDRDGFYKYLRDMGYNEKPGLLNSEGLQAKAQTNSSKFAWVQTGKIIEDGKAAVEANNKNGNVWQQSLDASDGSVKMTYTYIGNDDNWMKKGMNESGQVTWTPPSKTTLYPGDEVSIQMNVAHINNTHKNQAGGWTGLAQIYKIDNNGGQLGAAAYLTDNDGKSSFTSGVGNNYGAISSTVMAKVGQGNQVGERMAIRVSASGKGMAYRVSYVYTWQGVSN